MKKINDMIQILEEKGRFKETKNLHSAWRCFCI